MCRTIARVCRTFAGASSGRERTGLKSDIDPIAPPPKHCETSTKDPTDVGFHLGLANACVLQYESTRAGPSPGVEALGLAVTHAREACELNPANAEGWATFGFVLERIGEREKALAALRRATTLDPTNWLHHRVSDPGVPGTAKV